MRDSDDELAGPFGHRPAEGGTNGSHPEGMETRPRPFEEVSEPIDLAALQADDELISALAAGMAVSAPGVDGYDDDDRLALMLAAWKAEVDAEPLPDLVDVDTAVAAVVAARPPGRRARHLVPLAGAAALIVFLVGGVSIGAHDARPGDPLWGVSKVLYSEHAESVEAAVEVENRLTAAKAALASGQTEVAAAELAGAQAALGGIRAEDGLVALAEQQQFLAAKLQETPPGTPTDPDAPLAGAADRPPAVGDTSARPPSPLPGTSAPGPAPAPTGPGQVLPPAPDTPSTAVQSEPPVTGAPTSEPPDGTSTPTTAVQPDAGSTPSGTGSTPSATGVGSATSSTTSTGTATGTTSATGTATTTASGTGTSTPPGTPAS